MPKRMPENWQAPMPAFDAVFTENQKSLTFVQLGIQYKSHDAAAKDLSDVENFLKLSEVPTHIDRGRFIDPQGFTNDIFMLYWLDADAYGTWQKESGFEAWWQNTDNVEGSVGFWIETAAIALNQAEFNYSSNHPKNKGIFGHADSVEMTNVHAYWGSARDRIPASEHDDMVGVLDHTSLKLQTEINGQGERLKVKIPNNLCIIRTAQDWSDTTGLEREIYMQKVQPTLAQGVDYLQNSVNDSGCISCKYITELDDAGNLLDKSCVIAAFADMKLMENWTEHHPTHLQIFGTAMGMVQEIMKQGGFPNTRLWHEVSVLPEHDGSYGEYINCHATTGLLAFLPAVKL